MRILSCILLTSLIIMSSTVIAQEIIPLYKNVPNSIPAADKETVKTDANGIMIISGTTKPTLTIFLPDASVATGAAVVICPGGGYAVTAFKHEGTDVAKEFAKAGVAAFVLKYRLPDSSIMNDPSIGPLQDAQQAIKLVRDNAAKWKIDPKRVGIAGFSAGGHLASTAATHFNKSYIENTENTNLRPDFAILLYPVINFNDSTIAHKGSAENLLGKHASAASLKAYSNELQVTDDTPPTFLMHASDDEAVNVLNSIYFYEALLKHHVPAEMHIYKSGGHGFGLTLPGSDEKWMSSCINWMKASGWMKK